MNSDEIAEIKKTWEIPIANPTESGSAILIKFFTRYPSNLQKFAPFRDTPINELHTNPRFRAHALRIIRTFDDSIKLLGDDSCGPKLHEIWSTIGKTHFKRKIEKPAYNELREVLLEVLTEACKLNDQQIAAWTKLTDVVYNIIFTTMDQLESEQQ